MIFKPVSLEVVLLSCLIFTQIKGISYKDVYNGNALSDDLLRLPCSHIHYMGISSLHVALTDVE